MMHYKKATRLTARVKQETEESEAGKQKTNDLLQGGDLQGSSPSPPCCKGPVGNGVFFCPSNERGFRNEHSPFGVLRPLPAGAGTVLGFL